MKKNIFILFAFLFLIGTSMPKSVFAVTPVATEAASQDENTKPNKVDYILPYPGILADHPLYFLKKLRDQILERLISDPARKVEFYILQADKQLNAGIFLGEKNKQVLALTMFAEEGKFMDQAVKNAAFYQSQGKNVPGYLVERLNNAIDKHIKVLTELEQSVQESSKEQIDGVITLMGKLQADVGTLK